MTLHDWKRREDLQLRLDVTMNEPHMVEAISTLVSMGLPDGTQVADLTVNALRNAYNEGYFKALANLELLREIKPAETKPLPPAWQGKREE
jgi:hypothetical protein